MKPILYVLLLLAATGSAGATQTPPGTLYAPTPTLQNAPGSVYGAAPALPAAPGNAYAPTPAPQAAPGSAYAPTPSYPNGPAAIATASVPYVPLSGFGVGAAVNPSPPSPNNATPQAYAPTAAQAHAAPGSPQAPAPAGPASVYPTQAPPQFESVPPAPAQPGQSAQTALPADPWRSSQRLLADIAARERDGRLRPEQAMQFRIQVKSLDSSQGLKLPADARRMGASKRRALLRDLKAKAAEIRGASSQTP